jgi:hypothetical protein
LICKIFAPTSPFPSLYLGASGTHHVWLVTVGVDDVYQECHSETSFTYTLKPFPNWITNHNKLNKLIAGCSRIEGHRNLHLVFFLIVVQLFVQDKIAKGRNHEKRNVRDILVGGNQQKKTWKMKNLYKLQTYAACVKQKRLRTINDA